MGSKTGSCGRAPWELLKGCACVAFRLAAQDAAGFTGMPELSSVARGAIGLNFGILLRLCRCGPFSDGLRALWLCPPSVLDDVHTVLCKSVLKMVFGTCLRQLHCWMIL